MDIATWRPHIVSRLSCQASGGSEQSPPTNALILKSRCLNHRITAKRFSPMCFTGGDALVGRGAHRHAIGMFVVTEADAAAIRAVFNQEGELSAAIELRRRFRGITDNAKAWACARSIAGWMPLRAQPRTVTRLHPRKDG